MASKVTSVTSTAHFRTITSSSTYTIVDFYADWCGPCKVISPVFEQLANAESKPGKIVFAKVDVDAQREIAGNYGVSAYVPLHLSRSHRTSSRHLANTPSSMPTFLILKGTHVQQTIRGANATALRTAVLSAAADAAKGGSASGAFFSGKGQTLGSGSTPSARASGGPKIPNLGAAVSSPANFSQGSGLPQTVVRFLGLYLTTLFSTEPAAAAEQSAFRVQKGSGVGGRVRTVG